MDKTSNEELIRLKIENLSKSMEQLGGAASGIMLCVTQLKGLQKHNEMVEAKIKSRSEELELKEKELRALSSDLEQKVQAFEKEKSEADNLRKLVEECEEELRLKRNELTGKLDTSSRIQREIEAKRSQWRQNSAEIGRLCRETNKKKKELAMTVERVKESEKQVKMKSLELVSREKDLGSVRESIEVCNSELEVRKKIVQSLNIEIDSKSEESREIKRLVEQQTSELVVLQKQRDYIRSSSEMEERAKDKEKDLELLKSQIESEEKKLVQLKREIEEVAEVKKRDVELTLSKIEESVQQLAAVNEKLESQRRELEMQSVEQVSKQMELETLGESSKRFICDVEVKEKRLEELNNLIKISGEQFDLKSKELGEIERELKFKRHLRQMSSALVEREKQPISDNIQQNAEEEEGTEPIDTLMLDGISASLTRHEVSSVLRASPNPAEFVLDLVQDDIRKGLERAKDEIREGTSLQDTFLETLVLLFEELAKIQGPDKSQLLQLQATEVATLWKEKITIEAPKSSLEVLAFLLFIMAFGLKPLINKEETALLAWSIARYEHAPVLFEYLSINLIIREVVEELIKKSEYISAVKLICLFTLDNEVSFSPSELLKKEIISFRRCALENRSSESSSQAKEKDGGRLRAILELVTDYKLEINLPGDLIDKLMVEGERSVPLVSFSVDYDTPSSTPQADLQKKQLGQTEMVLVKHTGVDEENLGTTDVNSSNETYNPYHPPIIHTYHRRRN